MADDKTNILLAEYQEAGVLCREFEGHCRTAITILISLSTAILGLFKLGACNVDGLNLFLPILGILTSIITVKIILRSQSYYRNYINRAKEIETILGMSLYKTGSNDISGTPTKTLLMYMGCFILFLWVIFIFNYKCKL